MNLIHRHIFLNVVLTCGASVGLFGFVLMLGNALKDVALALAYSFASTVAGWFDNHPALRPDLLMWLPNIAFQSLGLWMFHRIDRS